LAGGVGWQTIAENGRQAVGTKIPVNCPQRDKHRNTCFPFFSFICKAINTYFRTTNYQYGQRQLYLIWNYSGYII
jgi:hypothetical protein